MAMTSREKIAEHYKRSAIALEVTREVSSEMDTQKRTEGEVQTFGEMLNNPFLNVKAGYDNHKTE
ncbi:hypothetical protein AAIE21_19855 [Paenibacillus sp. 102]|uniref:hypothetical protein n=1 Tax=Paenibacillus sp. 102 TaxID=3120823 RepID=UPI0031BB9681